MNLDRLVIKTKHLVWEGLQKQTFRNSLNYYICIAHFLRLLASLRTLGMICCYLWSPNLSFCKSDASTLASRGGALWRSRNTWEHKKGDLGVLALIFIALWSISGSNFESCLGTLDLWVLLETKIWHALWRRPTNICLCGPANEFLSHGGVRDSWIKNNEHGAHTPSIRDSSVTHRDTPISSDSSKNIDHLDGIWRDWKRIGIQNKAFGVRVGCKKHFCTEVGILMISMPFFYDLWSWAG